MTIPTEAWAAAGAALVAGLNEWRAAVRARQADVDRAERLRYAHQAPRSEGGPAVGERRSDHLDPPPPEA